MKTVYQVQSKFPFESEWLDDHLPFDTEQEAQEYIKTQPKCLEYKIVSWEEPETDSEWLEFNDALDAIGGDWEGQNMEKRYQYWTKDGIQWTEWFPYDGPKEPYQLGKKLKNEYRET